MRSVVCWVGVGMEVLGDGGGRCSSGVNCSVGSSLWKDSIGVLKYLFLSSLCRC